ncbi:MAG TPA: class I SAM-dependent methyltransferase, partial [Polyangiaceae bacterium]|nr:class I SAM-dependent methyltransferase [Polyangiaceae bacterium]
HYDELLGGVYAWSVTSSGEPFERGKRWLEAHGLMNATHYLDLGAGFGAHVLPLLAAGKQVTAVDFNAELLGQLAEAAGEAPGLRLERAELIAYLEANSTDRWDVILCLGDTLTHLESTSAVRQLLASAARHLKPEGRLALSYRDSSAFSAEGVARFIPVARDRARVMYCLLEPIDATYLRVTDIVTEVTDDGLQTRLGEYLKLRLARATLIDWALGAGLGLESEDVEQGMTSLVFRRSFA